MSPSWGFSFQAWQRISKHGCELGCSIECPRVAKRVSTLYHEFWGPQGIESAPLGSIYRTPWCQRLERLMQHQHSCWICLSSYLKPLWCFFKTVLGFTWSNPASSKCPRLDNCLGLLPQALETKIINFSYILSKDCKWVWFFSSGQVLIDNKRPLNESNRGRQKSIWSNKLT